MSTGRLSVGGRMARKRMIDPDIWTDDKVLKLSWTAVPFYIGLITQADDDGRIRYDVASLRAKIGPRDEVTCEHVEVWMWECVEVGLVLVYEHENVLFAYLPGWPDYQKVQHPNPSKLPAPPENIREVSRKIHEGYRNAHEFSRILMNFREDYRNAHPRSDQLDQVRLDRSDQGKGAQTRTARPRIEKSDLPTFADLEPDVQAYIANAAAENKLGTITLGRELTIRRELQVLQAELAALFGPALREANKHGAANANYVRRVAEGMSRRGAPLAAVPEKLQHGYDADGNMCAVSRGKEPNGWSTIPPRGRKMDDLWPEHKNYGTDYDPPGSVVP